MNDIKKTRIKVSAVTSAGPDNRVMASIGTSDPTINLTIGSCLLTLVYLDVEIRDLDLKNLNLVMDKFEV